MVSQPGPLSLAECSLLSRALTHDVADSSEVARTAGRILDICTGSNNQVAGQALLDTDSNFNILIRQKI